MIDCKIFYIAELWCSRKVSTWLLEVGKNARFKDDKMQEANAW